MSENLVHNLGIVIPSYDNFIDYFKDMDYNKCEVCNRTLFPKFVNVHDGFHTYNGMYGNYYGFCYFCNRFSGGPPYSLPYNDDNLASFSNKLDEHYIYEKFILYTTHPEDDAIYLYPDALEISNFPHFSFDTAKDLADLYNSCYKNVWNVVNDHYDPYPLTEDKVAAAIESEREHIIININDVYKEKINKINEKYNIMIEDNLSSREYVINAMVDEYEITRIYNIYERIIEDIENNRSNDIDNLNFKKTETINYFANISNDEIINRIKFEFNECTGLSN